MSKDTSAPKSPAEALPNFNKCGLVEFLEREDMENTEYPETVKQVYANLSKFYSQNLGDNGLQKNIKEVGPCYIGMNMGYADFDEADYPDDFDLFNQYVLEGKIHYSRLYRETVGNAVLEGKDLLEVGCGRGGGSRFMSTFYNPKSLTSVDITPESIEFCKKVHADLNINFQVGNAVALPFPDASFDVVVNVESSHCYPSLKKFFSEVHRVLRPGGVFLYTDQLGEQRIEDAIDSSLLKIAYKRDITGNIVKSVDIRSRSACAAYYIRRIKNLGIADLQLDGNLLSYYINNLSYWIYHMQKI